MGVQDYQITVAGGKKLIHNGVVAHAGRLVPLESTNAVTIALLASGYITTTLTSSTHDVTVGGLHGQQAAEGLQTYAVTVAGTKHINHNLVTLLGPLAVPPQPVGAALAGATNLLAGSYQAVATYTTAAGETTASVASAAVVLTGGQQFQITVPGPAPAGAVNVKVYLTVAPATTTLGYLGQSAASSGAVVVTQTTKTQGNAVAAPGTNTSAATLQLDPLDEPALTFVAKGWIT